MQTMKQKERFAKSQQLVVEVKQPNQALQKAQNLSHSSKIDQFAWITEAHCFGNRVITSQRKQWGCIPDKNNKSVQISYTATKKEFYANKFFSQHFRRNRTKNITD